MLTTGYRAQTRYLVYCISKLILFKMDLAPRPSDETDARPPPFGEPAPPDPGERTLRTTSSMDDPQEARQVSVSGDSASNQAFFSSSMTDLPQDGLTI